MKTLQWILLVIAVLTFVGCGTDRYDDEDENYPYAGEDQSVYLEDGFSLNSGYDNDEFDDYDYNLSVKIKFRQKNIVAQDITIGAHYRWAEVFRDEEKGEVFLNYLGTGKNDLNIQNASIGTHEYRLSYYKDFGVGYNLSDKFGIKASYQYDTVLIHVRSNTPTAKVKIYDEAFQRGETSRVVIKFSEEVINFANEDVTTQNGTLTTFTSYDNIRWNATFTPTDLITDNNNVISLANSYTGTSGTQGTAATSNNYSIYTISSADTISPTATINMSDSSLLIGETSQLTIVFSEEVNNFDNDDLIVPAGTLGTLTTADNITWSATYTPAESITDDSNVISLANTYADTSGNTGTTASSANFTIDTRDTSDITSPTATISMDDTALLEGETSLVTIIFSEAVDNFTNIDVTSENGTLSTFITASTFISPINVRWTATFTPINSIIDDTNIISLANTYTDFSGNIGTTATSANYTIDTTPIASDPFIAGYVDTPGNAHGIIVSGNYAYLSDGAKGLQIIDVSDPTTPIIVHNVDVSSIELANNDPASHYTSDISISGNYAYVADSHAGLQVVDISDPLTASIVANVDTPGQAYIVDILGNYAYIADWDAGLQIIDISNPLSPSIIKTVSMPSNASTVKVSGNYAYVADSASGLQIVDISNPATASIVASINTPGDAKDVVISGTYAYVVGYLTLHIIDISNPLLPSIVDSVATLGYHSRVNVLGNYAFVTNGYVDNAGDPQIHVVDISNPTNAVIVDNINLPSYSYDNYISGSYIYVADSEEGLQIIDMGPYKVP